MIHALDTTHALTLLARILKGRSPRYIQYIDQLVADNQAALSALLLDLSQEGAERKLGVVAKALVPTTEAGAEHALLLLEELESAVSRFERATSYKEALASWYEIQMVRARIESEIKGFGGFFFGVMRSTIGDMCRWSDIMRPEKPTPELMREVRKGYKSIKGLHDSITETCLREVRKALQRFLTKPDSQAKRIILVGCGADKAEGTHQARDLYTSTYFQAKRNYAEASGLPWFLLSGLHGLLSPGEAVCDYEYNLSKQPPKTREAWGRQVASQLARKFSPEAPLCIEFHAGEAYRRSAMAAIREVLGLRAQESAGRAGKPMFECAESKSSGVRQVDTWLAIHDWTAKQVWDRIKRCKLDYHMAYNLGMPRLSCAFCIFANKDALMTSARENRETLAELVRIEKKNRRLRPERLAQAEADLAALEARQADLDEGEYSAEHKRISALVKKYQLDPTFKQHLAIEDIEILLQQEDELKKELPGLIKEYGGSLRVGDLDAIKRYSLIRGWIMDHAFDVTQARAMLQAFYRGPDASRLQHMDRVGLNDYALGTLGLKPKGHVKDWNM